MSMLLEMEERQNLHVKKTVYIIGNRVDKVDSKALAGGASDYTIDTRFNFVDMLINGLTFGIVGTRTVIIKK